VTTNTDPDGTSHPDVRRSRPDATDPSVRQGARYGVYIVGVNKLWKSSWQRFFGHLKPIYVSKPDQVPEGATALIWGLKTPDSAFHPKVTVYRVEDGFIRSVGLGAEFTQPCSWVIDRRGLYFDATRPSDLEHMLQHETFSDALQQRAEALIQQLNQSGINKYNTGNTHWPQGAALQAQAEQKQQRILLVPGQVETDASIQLGSPQLKTNISLLQRVREDNPQALIIYKPHPDVVAGARGKGRHEQKASDYADVIVTDVSINHVLAIADEVHTLTSLTGFEALLRWQGQVNKQVHCYGQPFYSGWGLTRDHLPNPRRSRRRSLAELVAASLICYPRYSIPGYADSRDNRTAEVGPEEVINWLSHRLLKQQREQSSTTAFTVRAKTRLISTAKRLLRRVIKHTLRRY